MAWWNKKEKTVTQKAYNQADIDQMRQEIAANAAQAEGLRKRLSSAVSGTYDNSDSLHNVYLDYGYPLELEFPNYWNMYRRLGIAKNVVELPVDTCWLSAPTIEGDAKFNKDFETMVELVKFWQRMKGLDNRQRVGRYAGMFMRVKDGKKPNEPLEGKLPGVLALTSMMPLYEGQLTVSTTETNPMADNFGMPTMYHFNSSATGNRNDKAAGSFDIHPTRLVIASEGADDGGIYGISSLEAPFNSLMDLRKIMGAGGEGFYKNAAQSVVFNLTDATSAQQNAALLDAFNENYDDFARNRTNKAMWTPGMEANTMDSSLTDPKEFFFNCMYDVSAATKIPATIIIGQQTGRLASDSDNGQYLIMMKSRQENFLSELIESTIEWLIEYGLLPASKFEIEWDDLLASSDDEKLGNADKMATINEKQFRSGQGPVFEPEEIRGSAGLEPEELPEFSEELPEDGVIDEN